MGRTACTEPVPVQYTHNSTPPMGRTACTVPQCLYSIAIPPLPLWTVRPVQSLSACTSVRFTFAFMYSIIILNYNLPRAHGFYEHIQNIPHRRPQSEQTLVITSVGGENCHLMSHVCFIEFRSRLILKYLSLGRPSLVPLH